ncbi:MAG: exodeoxyribonuclease VII small subunit [Bdellovibrionales bacterium]|nr:exodeoxyribonuclease VII small subunit [Bdellovibrionales bacterium]
MNKKVSLKDLLSEEDATELFAGLNFEDALQLLEQLVEKVEGGNLSLDHSMLAYEKGVRLVERLRALLSQAESKLQILSKEEGAGE